MNIYQWLVEEWENGNLIPHIEDDLAIGVFEMTQAVKAPQVTGNLDIKLVAMYLKQAHKEHAVMVQRAGEDFFMSTGFMMVKVPAYYKTTLAPFLTFDASWERFTFSAKEQEAREGGPDQQAFWTRTMNQDAAERLIVTNWLHEITSRIRNKTGQLTRRLVAEGEEDRTVLIDKKLCDLLNPDADELDNFLFEQAGADQPVRVACRYGYVAILMPMQVNR